jgi:hypothetical protein
MDHAQAAGRLLVERYLLHELGEEEREAFEQHFFSCRECSTDVILGSIFLDSGRLVALGGGPRAEAIEGLFRWIASLTEALRNLLEGERS